MYNGRRKLRRAVAILFRRVARIGARGILTTRRKKIARASQSARRLSIAPPTDDTWEKVLMTWRWLAIDYWNIIKDIMEEANSFKKRNVIGDKIEWPVSTVNSMIDLMST